jgi:hypothetical protein
MAKPHPIRVAFALFLAASLSGCIFFETKAMRAMRNDPNFKAGYSDGCASANARGASFRGEKVRDDALFKTSEPYRAGWSNGYSTCNNQLYSPGTPNVSDMPDHRPNP